MSLSARGVWESLITYSMSLITSNRVSQLLEQEPQSSTVIVLPLNTPDNRASRVRRATTTLFLRAWKMNPLLSWWTERMLNDRRLTALLITASRSTVRKLKNLYP